MAQQNIHAQVLGLIPINTLAANTLALNTAASGGFSATWLAFGFVPSVSDSVTTVRVWINSVANTLAATDCVCDIYSDSVGHPNVSLGSVSLGSAPTGAGWVTFTFGAAISVTSGTQYWIVLRNANATPTTNAPTYGWLSGLHVMLPGLQSSGAAIGWIKQSSTNSGTSWSASQGSYAGGYRIGYSSGAYQGQPYSAFAASTVHVQGGATPNEEGVKLTLPGTSSLQYNIAGVVMPANTTGTPTGDPKFNLYVGGSTTTPTASTSNWPGATQGYIQSYFSSRQQVSGGSIIRVTLADSATDTASNYFSLSTLFTADTDANSLPLAPFEGTAQYTKLVSGAWADDTGHIPAFGLILDSTGELTATGGGGGGGSPAVLRGNTWRYVG